MKLFFFFFFSLSIFANPTTLLDEESGFYKNNTTSMLPMYESKSCTGEIVNYIPVDAICIIAIKRYKNGKVLLEYMGRQGWVDVNENNQDNIVLMKFDELQAPTLSVCSQVGPTLFEVKSIMEGRAVKVYAKPSSKSKVIYKLDDHESCLINLGCHEGWCRVDTGDGVIGWVISINLNDQIEHVDGYCASREINFLIE